MADKKISALPAATVPLAGTEVLPVVQSGATDKVSVANLTSGRTIDFAGAYATNATAATFRGYSIGGANTSTEFGSLKMEVSTGVMRLAAGFTGWGGQLALSTNGVDRVTISSAGNATFNTGNLVVGTAGTVPSNLNQASLGSGPNSPINGHIRRIRYYPTRLSNAQLQALTA